MNRVNIFYKLNKAINNYDYFKIPVDNQKQYLNSAKSAKDLMECSLLQYKCQNLLRSKLTKLFSNIGACFMLLPVIIKYLKKSAIAGPEKFDRVGVYTQTFLKEGYLPQDYTDKLEKIISIEGIGGSLLKEDYNFIIDLLRKNFFRPYFVLKNVIKIAQYTEAIRCYHPEVIFCSAEYSFTSSILTEFCRRHGIKHINVMHGDRVFNITDAYATFDECYIWDEYYEQYFKNLKSQTAKFCVFYPEIIFPRSGKLQFDISETVDYKYYLGDMTKKELEELKWCYEEIKKRGYSIRLRWHPGIDIRQELIKFSDEQDLEDPKNINIIRSVCEADNIISRSSTVLTQGYNIGKNIVIDDITNPLKYKELKSANYIILNKEHKLLSEILKGGEI